MWEPCNFPFMGEGNVGALFVFGDRSEHTKEKGWPYNGDLEITVFQRPDKPWQMSTSHMALRDKELKATNLEEAKVEAVTLVREWLARQLLLLTGESIDKEKEKVTILRDGLKARMRGGSAAVHEEGVKAARAALEQTGG